MEEPQPVIPDPVQNVQGGRADAESTARADPTPDFKPDDLPSAGVPSASSFPEAFPSLEPVAPKVYSTPPPVSFPSFSDAQPTPNGIHFDPIPSFDSAQTLVNADDKMKVDEVVEPNVGISLSTSASVGSIGSIKRSEPDHPGEGEEDDVKRFAKRPREEDQVHEMAGNAEPVVASGSSAVAGAAVEDVPMVDTTAVREDLPMDGAAISGNVADATTGPEPVAASNIGGPPSVVPPSVQEAASSAAVPPSAALPIDPPIYIVGTYQPVPKSRFGATSPLTATQHKSLTSYIRTMKRTKEASVFLQPVDPIAMGIPHYPKYITRPSDIGTIESKLAASDPDPKKRARVSQADVARGSYACVADVVDEVRQIFVNTRVFNGPAHWVSMWADKLEEGFDKYLEKAPLGEAPPPQQAPTPPAQKALSPAIDPQHQQRARRPSVSVPTIRRNSSDGFVAPPFSAGGAEGPGGSRPKREIHPPAPKDQAYEAEGSSRKGGPEAQFEWARRAVEDVKRLPYAVDFLEPVDAERYNLPTYHTIVKSPMDLGTISKKIAAKHVYKDVSEVDRDVRLMCKNAMMFNQPGQPVYLAAEDIERFWAGKWSHRPWAKGAGGGGGTEEDAELKEIDRQIAELQARRAEVVRRGIASRENRERAKQSSSAGGVANGHKSGGHKSTAASSSKPAGGGRPKQSSSSGKARKPSVGGTGANGRSSQGNGGGPRKSSSARYHDEDEDERDGDDKAAMTALSQQQKQDLADKIGNAAPEVLQQAIVIIQESTKVGDNGEEIELDIDALPAQTVVRLYNLVVQGLAGGKAKTKRRNKPKQAQHGGMNGGGGASGGGKKKGSEMERIQKMEQQLAVPDDEGESDASSVAYSEEEYSAEEA